MKFKRKNIEVVLIFTLSLFSPFFCSAFSDSLVINEIAWMGTEKSYNDEWIEIHNPRKEQVAVSNWKLVSDDGSPVIILKGNIPAEGFLLLERTNQETLPNIKESLIYKGSLKNSGENLKLLDSSGKIIDEAVFSGGWPAGNNKTKQTMERVGSSWQTSKDPGGTPGAENSSGATEAETKTNSSTTNDNVSEKSSGKVLPAKSTGENLKEPSGNFYSFILAAIIAAASGITALILKKIKIGEDIKTKDKR